MKIMFWGRCAAEEDWFVKVILFVNNSMSPGASLGIKQNWNSHFSK